MLKPCILPNTPQMATGMYLNPRGQGNIIIANISKFCERLIPFGSGNKVASSKLLSVQNYNYWFIKIIIEAKGCNVF